MKLLKVLAAVLLMTVPAMAWAGKSAPFKGVYEIISETEKSTADKPFFLFDNDTLGVLWSKYITKPFPENLEKYRQEQSIIAGFSARDILFFTLEQGTLITPNYLSIEGGPGEKLEMRRRADGGMDMAVKEGLRTTIYLLAAPTPVPDSD